MLSEIHGNFAGSVCLREQRQDDHVVPVLNVLGRTAAYEDEKRERAAGAPGSVRSRRTIRDAKCANDGEGRGEEQIPSDKGRDSQTLLVACARNNKGKGRDGEARERGRDPDRVGTSCLGSIEAKPPAGMPALQEGG